MTHVFQCLLDLVLLRIEHVVATGSVMRIGNDDDEAEMVETLFSFEEIFLIVFSPFDTESHAR